MTSIRMASAGLLLCVAAGAAAAQSSPPTTVPGTSLDDHTSTLSKKLNETEGVIAPKGNVDPDMHMPAPQTGKMPVIRPHADGPESGGLY